MFLQDLRHPFGHLILDFHFDSAFFGGLSFIQGLVVHRRFDRGFQSLFGLDLGFYLWISARRRLLSILRQDLRLLLLRGHISPRLTAVNGYSTVYFKTSLGNTDCCGTWTNL